MVTFTDHSFTIEVKTGTNPIESWLDTHDDIISCLQSEDQEMISKHYHLLELLRCMMPDWETAKKLTE